MKRDEKIAKKLLLSFLQHQNEKLRNIYQYALDASKSLHLYFKDNCLIDNLVHHIIRINPHEISSDLINKNIYVNVLLLYADKLDGINSFNGVIHKEYSFGVAEYLQHHKKHYIVIYGSSNKNDFCFNEKFFRTSFVHELIHLLDTFLYKDELQEEYSYGHPVDGFMENGGVPFPGMNGEQYDVFDEIFAEYFTCKAERRQYTYDLIDLIEQYANYVKMEQTQVVEQMIEALSSKNSFKSLSQKFKRTGLNYASLALIYHLAFSKQKNGNKYDAMKILKDLL